MIGVTKALTVSGGTGYRSPWLLGATKTFRCTSRVSTVQCPKVIYVFELLLFKVLHHDSQR